VRRRRRPRLEKLRGEEFDSLSFGGAAFSELFFF